MKQLAASIMLAALVATGCGSRSPAAPSPADSVGDGWIEGKLLDGIVAIGAETTGWAIEQPLVDGTVSRVEIDCAKVEQAAAALVGKRVRAVGDWEERTYVERGPVRVFVAAEITAAP